MLITERRKVELTLRVHETLEVIKCMSGWLTDTVYFGPGIILRCVDILQLDHRKFFHILKLEQNSCNGREKLRTVFWEIKKSLTGS
jgi:hypothetical protein